MTKQTETFWFVKNERGDILPFCGWRRRDAVESFLGATLSVNAWNYWDDMGYTVVRREVKK